MIFTSLSSTLLRTSSLLKAKFNLQRFGAIRRLGENYLTECLEAGINHTNNNICRACHEAHFYGINRLIHSIIMSQYIQSVAYHQATQHEFVTQRFVSHTFRWPPFEFILKSFRWSSVECSLRRSIVIRNYSKKLSVQ